MRLKATRLCILKFEITFTPVKMSTPCQAVVFLYIIALLCSYVWLVKTLCKDDELKVKPEP